MIKRCLIFAARLYQRTLSPMKLPSCRFYPSCSAYFIEAVETHGALKGLLLGVYRILRCNPFSRGGYDPVPESTACKQNRHTSRDNH